jgi:hypothetical protein
MSTRCQIGIYEDASVLKGRPDELPVPSVLIYRHSDGYAGKIDDGSGNGKIGVVPDILPFLKEFIKLAGYDVEYMGACLMTYIKQFHCGRLEYDNSCGLELNGIKISVLGHGICNKVDYCIPYYYAIIPDKLLVYELRQSEYINIMEYSLTSDWKFEPRC